MKKASEYRQHAAECRKLASSMDGEHRELLLNMAETWDRLAEERTAALAETRSFCPPSGRAAAPPSPGE